MKKLGLVLFAVLMTACSAVGPTERGVRITFGQAGDESLLPGYYLWVPFILSMETMDVRIQRSDVKAPAASRDMQDVMTHVAINWSVDPATISTTYKTIGTEELILESIITPSLNEVLKSSISKKTAEELLTQRTMLKAEIDEALKLRLHKYGGIIVTDVSIVNFEFTPEFKDAIEKKQIAEQQAKQAEYLAQKALNDGRAMEKLAEGQAKAQALLRTSLTDDLLKKMAIEKWDGHFPTVMGGSGVVPFINFSDLK